jgi:surface antigen
LAYHEQWSVDPALNSAAAPLGAPEGGLAWDRVSDTFRVVMAGIAELRESLKGGTPTSDLAANSTKFAGRTRQQAYDDYWPVGSERAWNSTSATGIVPSGLTATWTLVAADAFLVGASTTGIYTSPGATVGTNTAAETGAAGAHDHGGTTGSTTLTINQMPLHSHPTRVSTAAVGSSDGLGGLMLDDDNLANYPGYTGTPDNDPGQQIGGTGGGAGHAHSLSSVGDHTHNISLPRRYVTAWFKRTA